VNSLTWKRRIGHWFGRALSDKRDAILLYHSVAGGAYSVSEPRFRLQMAWLKKHATVVPLHDLLAPRAMAILDRGSGYDVGIGELFGSMQSLLRRARHADRSRMRVALTFDDGYRTLADTVQPIVAEHGFPVTAFLNTGMIGNGKRLPSRPEFGHYPDEEFLNWEDVAKLNRQGWTIGGHGIDHVDLTRVSRKEVDRQLMGCKQEITARLGRPCVHYAYTWGHNNAAVRRAVVRAGYFCAVGVIHGPVTSVSPWFTLPRLDIRTEYELEDFVAVMSGRWDFLGLKQRAGDLASWRL
jgi:peptidoglycan/xylan/chitin deacetylase (PgdA/CDA1 family)